MVQVYIVRANLRAPAALTCRRRRSDAELLGTPSRRGTDAHTHTQFNQFYLSGEIYLGYRGPEQSGFDNTESTINDSLIKDDRYCRSPLKTDIADFFHASDDTHCLGS